MNKLWRLPALLHTFALVGCSATPDASTGASGDACDAGGAAFDGPFEVPTGPMMEAPLTGCAGPGYAAKFLVGTQTFDLTIDTGSGTLALASNACATCGVTPAYSPGPSAVDDGPTSDTYLAGSWQGEVYTDSVKLVGAAAATNMKIAAIDSQSGFFQDAGCGLGTVPFAPQGVVGFGPADLVAPGTDAFFTEFLHSSGLPAVLALELCAQGGQLMVGGVDPTAAELTGPALYTPLILSKYYGVTLTDVRFGDASLGFGSADFGTTVVDTGTSVLAFPSAVYQSLASAIEATPAFATAFGSDTAWLGTSTCVTSALSEADMDCQFPALTLSFPAPGGGTSVVTMKATESYLPPTSSNGKIYYCSGIFRNPQASGTILGSSAMLGQMVIFDLDGNRVGFAPQKYCH